MNIALNTEEFYINLISSNNYYKSLPFLISNNTFSSNSINNHKIANEKNMFNKNKENNQLKSSLLFKINRPIPQAILENNINIIIKNMNITKEIKIKFSLINNMKNEKVENVIEKNIKSKRKKKKIKKKIKNMESTKFGTKKADDNLDKIHNKYSEDNISYKIKNVLNWSLISFIKKVINRIYNAE